MSDDAVAAARIAELEADNRRLRRLLNKLGAPIELRHRLRNTIAILRSIIRKSAETSGDLETYVAHIEDRLDALARAQAAADEHGSIDLHSILADELHQYGAGEGAQVTLSGPDMRLTPRTGQVLALALHELAVNALAHGSLRFPAGRIEVTWTQTDAAPAPWLTLVWKESGASSIGEPQREGFGTEVLTRMLPYDIQAETELAFEPDGLRCTIRLPLPKAEA